MYLDFSTLNARTAYYWLASTVTPRPVAWVSSLSADGVANLAPFSFFQVVTHTPPTLMICPLVNSDGSMKDTAANIAATGEFVVNLVPHTLVQQMNQTSFGYDRATSEWERAGLAGLPSSKVKPQRVSGVPVSFECRRVSVTPYPADAPSCYIILGEVVAAHIDEAIVGTNQQIDPMALDLVSRMGADWYGRTRSEANFELTRPEGWAR
ncbi:MAG: flavin reductase family protein [Pseudomonadota bacterium]